MTEIFTDQLGNELKIDSAPKRIISLVPSQTELLFDLGLGERIIGVTKFCIHHAKYFKTKPFVGGTKKVNIDLINALQPDLIIGNKEENSLEDILDLQKNFPVWMSDIDCLANALEMIDELGKITQTSNIASEIIKNISKNFNALPKPKKKKAVYMIWNEPMMATGGDTFINDMMDYAGFENIYKDVTRYPVLSIEELQNKGPEFILLSSEPYPFKLEHKTGLHKFFPNATILLVDGEMFSWYGSRLLLTPAYFSDAGFYK